MTDRIRWHDEPSSGMAACTGSVGTLNPAMFHIWRPDAHCAEWQLTTRLHDMEQKHCYGGDPEELKDQAEHWLAEFTSSLGAVFGDAVAADLRSRADDLEAMVCREPGQERDNLLFSAGLKRAADLIEHGDIPGTTAATAAREKEQPDA